MSSAGRCGWCGRWALNAVRKQVEIMELETRRFYERAMERVTDASIRKLLGDLAEVEREHYNLAGTLEEKHLTPEARRDEETAQRRLFLLQVVQPGLAGLMDGSVSDAGPVVRRRLRHAQKPGRISGRPRGLHGRRHIHGLRRSALGRRLAYRPRVSLVPGHGHAG